MDGIIIPPTGTATITGGSINGTPIGNTTPSTGSFTTLSSSGPATFNIWGAATNGAQEIRPNGSGSTVGRITINAAGDLMVSSATAQNGTAGVGSFSAAGGGYFGNSLYANGGIAMPAASSVIWTSNLRLKTSTNLLSVRNAADSADAAINVSTAQFTGLTDTGKQIAGATGAVTQNCVAGQVQFAAAATSLVVTNSLVTANSVIVATLGSVDASAVLNNATAAAGSFTLSMKAAPTGVTKVNYHVIN